MYQEPRLRLFPDVNDFPARQRTTEWANEHDGPALSLVLDEALADSGVRTVGQAVGAQEVGTWSLEYLGPGFHVQLRIARRQRQARVDGWMSPAQPIKILLSSLLRQPVVLEAHVSESGRFEFPVAPTGACRMSFVTDQGRPPATPPFWI